MVSGESELEGFASEMLLGLPGSSFAFEAKDGREVDMLKRGAC